MGDARRTRVAGRTGGTRAGGRVYRRRRPERTVLHRLVRTHLETYLARAEAADPVGGGVPAHVEAQFRAYLRCGVLAHGFARARCSGCGEDFLVAFSCKGRGICPSCNARRMAATAAHLTDHVIPRVPVRQWVLSVPKRLRWHLHRDPEAASAVLRILVRALRRTVRERSPGAGPGAQFGAVTFLHRFGSSLNPHFHYHLCVLDGVFEGEEGEGADGTELSRVRFHEATGLRRTDVEALQETVRRRVLRWFERHGRLEDHVVDEMLGWGHGGGFSLDASVRIAAHDRVGLERLIRGHRREALVARGRPSPWSGWSGAKARTTPPGKGWCSTIWPGPPTTAGRWSGSPRSSCSTAWRRCCRRPGCTATATTACSPPTRSSARW